MIAVVIIGHGNIASETVSVAERIIGKQEHFEAINVRVGEAEETIKQNLDRIIKMAEIDGVLILSDLLGSSFSNTCIYVARNSDCVAVVTGFNMPMVLKVLTHRKDVELSELVLLACKWGKEGILEACKKLDTKNKV
jgi:mannose/fructose-specific phosphotransferase system component IIA